MDKLRRAERRIDITSTSYKSKHFDQTHQNALFRTLEAIYVIVRDKLYKARASTMEQYFGQQFRISRAQVYRLLDCYTIIQELKDFPQTPLKQRICRTLKGLAKSAEARRHLWTAVLDRFGIDGVPALSSNDIKVVWKEMLSSTNLQLSGLNSQEDELGTLPLPQCYVDTSAWSADEGDNTSNFGTSVAGDETTVPRSVKSRAPKKHKQKKSKTMGDDDEQMDSDFTDRLLPTSSHIGFIHQQQQSHIKPQNPNHQQHYSMQPLQYTQQQTQYTPYPNYHPYQQHYLQQHYHQQQQMAMLQGMDPHEHNEVMQRALPMYHNGGGGGNHDQNNITMTGPYVGALGLYYETDGRPLDSEDLTSYSGIGSISTAATVVSNNGGGGASKTTRRKKKRTHGDSDDEYIDASQDNFILEIARPAESSSGRKKSKSQQHDGNIPINYSPDAVCNGRLDEQMCEAGPYGHSFTRRSSSSVSSRAAETNQQRVMTHPLHQHSNQFQHSSVYSSDDMRRSWIINYSTRVPTTDGNMDTFFPMELKFDSASEGEPSTIVAATVNNPHTNSVVTNSSDTILDAQSQNGKAVDPRQLFLNLACTPIVYPSSDATGPYYIAQQHVQYQPQHFQYQDHQFQQQLQMQPHTYTQDQSGPESDQAGNMPNAPILLPPISSIMNHDGTTQDTSSKAHSTPTGTVDAISCNSGLGLPFVPCSVVGTPIACNRDDNGNRVRLYSTFSEIGGGVPATPSAFIRSPLGLTSFGADHDHHFADLTSGNYPYEPDVSVQTY